MKQTFKYKHMARCLLTFSEELRAFCREGFLVAVGLNWELMVECEGGIGRIGMGQGKPLSALAVNVMGASCASGALSKVLMVSDVESAGSSFSKTSISEK